MTVWIYYVTDGDSGWYCVKLFKTEKAAFEYFEKEGDKAYVYVTKIEVEE